jgi:8-oxo-dGTP diphosphatase
LPAVILLVRHAHAGTRSAWDAGDAERPLTEKGQHQAEALAGHLAPARVDRVLSSAAVRCRQTVEPLASGRGLAVEVHPALTEGAPAAATMALLDELAAAGTHAVLSSHGDVIPAALRELAGRGVELDASPGLPKGTYYELATEGGTVRRARFVDPRP